MVAVYSSLARCSPQPIVACSTVGWFFALEAPETRALPKGTRDPLLLDRLVAPAMQQAKQPFCTRLQLLAWLADAHPKTQVRSRLAGGGRWIRTCMGLF